MKKTARKFWTVVLVIANILLVGPMLLDFAVFWYDYMRATRIRMVQGEETPCRMDIPVRFSTAAIAPSGGFASSPPISGDTDCRKNLIPDNTSSG